MIINNISKFVYLSELKRCDRELTEVGFLFPGPPNQSNSVEDGKLKSEVIVKDNKRYYLDLKENARGRFLRVQFIFTFMVVFSCLLVLWFLFSSFLVLWSLFLSFLVLWFLF